MSQVANSIAASQVQEIFEKIKKDADVFSKFELKFIGDQVWRIKAYGERILFSEKQAALIERIHAELMRGEKVKPQKI